MKVQRRSVFAAGIVLAAGLPLSSAGAQQVEVKPDDMILGKADAPVTIVEYASLTCDHCGAFHRGKLAQIKKDWIDTGKARLVYRDFPFDAPALRAAMVARCFSGTNSDRFFGFLSVLYQQQESWSHAKDPIAALAKLSRIGGVSEEKFQTCLADRALEDRIVAMRLEGQKRYGVKSTPTFFINGQRVVGNVPYAEFEKALQAAGS